MQDGVAVDGTERLVGAEAGEAGQQGLLRGAEGARAVEEGGLDRLHEGPVGHRGRLLAAGAAQDEPAFAGGLVDQLLAQAALADAGGAGDEDGGGPALGDPAQGGAGPDQLDLPSHEGGADPARGGGAEDLAVQGECLWPGEGADLSGQDGLQALELADRGVAAAGVGVLSHELAVGGLVGGVGLGQVAPAPALAEEVDVPAVGPLSCGDGPLVVAVLGQDLAGVVVGLEGVEVDGEVG